jgi:hypothetical protein
MGLRLPGSNLELKLEHAHLRVLETELIDRDITLSQYLDRYRLNAATRLVQIGRHWEEPGITEPQADALIQQAKDAGTSFGVLYQSLVQAVAGKHFSELPRDLLEKEDAAPGEEKKLPSATPPGLRRQRPTSSAA